ncbi:MAG: hypothetical protein Q9208_007778 [Pyrenodesmia sp. 3 TL-2023]
MVLHFRISPTYQHKSWCTVESSIINENSTVKRKRLTQWHLQDLDEAMKRCFHKLPYRTMRKIQIDVGAPDRSDPGQVVSLYKKCVDLATMLENAESGLLNIEINLLDSEEAKWTWDGQPQNSITQHHTGDYELVLSAFSRLRDVESAKFRVPVQLDPDSHLIENMEAILRLEGPFGANLAPHGDGEWDDRDIQTDRDLMYVNLDLELDFLHGHTANMMRLDRFSSWYTDKLGGNSEYEREYERIIKTWKNLPEPPDRLFQLTVLERLQWRYEAMRVYDPRARFRPDAQGRSPAFFYSVQITSNATNLTSNWDPDEWHGTYHHGDWYGIPSFSSMPFLERWILHPWNTGVCRQYQDSFKEKLRGWLSADS